MTHAPGAIRDTIVDYLRTIGGPATLAQISQGVVNKIGRTSASSIRSSLNLHVGDTLERIGRGKYRLKGLNGSAYGHVNCHLNEDAGGHPILPQPAATIGKSALFLADCFEWFAAQ